VTTKPKTHKLIKPLEGYRALAILAVLIFHLDKQLLPGGYLGVDLFFVISGFIITKGLMSAKARDGLSLSTFYAKRFRRLFPALLVTTLVTLIASWFILVPEAFAETGKSALFSLFSLANVNFWMESGYFAADSSTKPLLHMWSLSVEEQFYLFWPFILAFFVPKTWRFWAFGLLILSFGATVWIARISPETAFFWFPFRIYEFMGGAILSILGLRIKNNWLATLALITGTALFLYACFAYDEVSNIALTGGVTVVACVLLLLSMESKLADWVFGNPVAFWIGQRSYSIYLVHWPLIVLYVAANGQLSGTEMVALGVFSFVLGAILKWLIEDPFRESRSPRSLPGQRAYPAIVATTAVSVFAASIVWGYQGFPGRLDVSLDDLLTEDARYETLMRKGTCFLSTDNSFPDMPAECYTPVRGKQNMLIIGSSVAADFRHGMETAFPDWNISQITAARCAPYIVSSNDPTCQSVRDLIFEDVLNTQKFDLVIIAGFGSRGAGQLARLESFMDERDIDYAFIGPRPQFDMSPKRIIARYGALDGLDTEMQNRITRPDDVEVSNTDRYYFSSVDAMCPSPQSCLWQIDGKLAYRDPLHLSPIGSEYVSAEFAKWYAERPSN